MYATSPRLKPDDSVLRRDPSVDRARRHLAGYSPRHRDQGMIRDRILQFIDRYPDDAHLRSRLEGHLTSSALVLDSTGQKILLLHHRKLGRWLQLGGHCDGDGNLPGVALREACEESGIPNLEIVPEIIDVDIHEIPERPREPRHLHLDSRFLVIAPEGAQPRGNHESNDLRWMSFDEVKALDVDNSVMRLLDGL